jgi:hypothetical protein
MFSGAKTITCSTTLYDIRVNLGENYKIFLEALAVAYKEGGKNSR